MTTVIVPHPKNDSKFIIKAALEKTPGIKSYYDNGLQITGKTGGQLGLFVSSYGEQVIVDISNDQPNNTETIISVTGKREVSTNIGSNPEKYVSSFIEVLNSIKDYEIDEITEVLQKEEIYQKSKEVNNISDQADGSWLMTIVMVFIFVIIIMVFLGI